MEETAIESGRGRGSASDLEGRWRVERLSGILPPMLGVNKEISGARGRTKLGPLPVLPFRVESREDCIALAYSPSFSVLIDELTAGSGDSWVGRTTLGGYKLGRFRMTRVF
jgi:hypothetical protein